MSRAATNTIRAPAVERRSNAYLTCYSNAFGIAPARILPVLRLRIRASSKSHCVAFVNPFVKPVSVKNVNLSNTTRAESFRPLHRARKPHAFVSMIKGYNSTGEKESNDMQSAVPSESDRDPMQATPTRIDTRLIALGGVTIAVIGGVILAWFNGLLSSDSFFALAQWFESLGPAAAGLYALLYFILELIAVPALPLTLGSGYLFGITTGTALVSVASTAAAAAAFLISRYGLRDFISSIATKYPRFRAMDRAIGREGFKFVFLLRLSPLMPFSISNYLYGLTSVNLFDYVLGSWLGMLPGTIAYVSTGAAVSALTDLNGVSTPVNPILLGIGCVATVFVLLFIGRLATNAVQADGEFEEEAA